ncbi:UbiA prenyltransferase family protein [Lutibacter oricola]|nr:hypothetical protein [Lutibacter oricola]
MTKISLLKINNYEDVTPLFVALSIIISYNFIRFYEAKVGKVVWFKDWFAAYKYAFYLINILSIVGLITLVFFTEFNLQSLVVLIPFGIMTFFYAIPILKIKNVEVSFRNFPFIKIFSIAFAWAGVTVIFPQTALGLEFKTTNYLEFIQRFFILLAIILPFDIRDIKYDLKKLKTLPQVVGVPKSKVLGIVFILFFVVLELLKTENYFFSTFIIGVITGMFLLFSSEKKLNYYASFWVEAIPIYWLVIILLNV